MTTYIGLDIEDQDQKPVLGKKSSRFSLRSGSTKSSYSSRSTDLKYSSTRAAWFFQDRYHDVLPFFKKTNHSIRRANWRVISKYAGVQLALWLIIIGFFVLTLYLPGIAYETFSEGTYSYAAGGCSPAGDFMPPYSQRNSEWDRRGFFQITLGFGHFSFSTAKFIDVAWDVVIGRGGQAAIAVISYVIFSKALLRIMEERPVSYGTFEALSFQTATASSIAKLMRDFWTNCGWRAKAAMLWIIISSIWIAAFPTFTSAMTGYSTNLIAYVQDYNGSLTPVNKFKMVDYTIMDAHRLNLTEPFNVLAVSLDDVDDGSSYSSSDNCALYSPSFAYGYGRDDPPLPKNCEMVWHVNVYTQNYGLIPEQNSSVFNMSGNIIELKPPTLDIRAHYLPSGYPPPFWNTTSRYHTDDNYFYNIGNAIYSYNNEIYNYTYLESAGVCNQETTYKWGFSFLLLFTFCIIQTVWCFGQYILWLDAHMSSRFVRAGRDMGTHRAALDFSKAMRKDMGEEATEVLGNAELRRRVRRKLNGGVIQMDMLDPGTLPLSRSEDLRLWWMANGVTWKQWQGWSLRRKALSILLVSTILVVIIVPAATSHG